MVHNMKNEMINLVDITQNEIVCALSEINEKDPVHSPWVKNELGSGLSIIIPEGRVFEKGGVNVSKVSGPVFGNMLEMMKIDAKESGPLTFFATGVSLVLHPLSPMIPTVHMNYRFFEIMKEGKQIFWFFGGGADLSPSYLFEEDVKHFHQTLKTACDKEDPDLYFRLKKECDEYFYLPHREEHRGVGGIFSMRRHDKPIEQIFNWSKNCAESFLPSYIPIIEKRQHSPYDETHKAWQSLRRGRYVEFNLIYDVGTSFGLKTKGNAESILMSLPPKASWNFHIEPKEGSPEAKMLKVLRKSQDWI